MAKVMLTGSLGYIGQLAERELRSRGHQVVSVDAGWFRDSILPGGNTRARYLVDLRNAADLPMHEVDAVIHLAALSNDPLGALDARLTDEVNVGTTVSLAKRAIQADVERFIFMSSCSVYGRGDVGPAKANEDSPPQPLTAYARSKAASEMALREVSDQIAVIVLRAGTAFGASPNPRLDLVVNDFVWAAMMQGQVTVRSAGLAWRPLIAARDIAALCTLFAEERLPSCGYYCYNAGQEENCIQILALAQTVSAELDVPIVMHNATDVDPRSYQPDFSKLESLLKGRFRFTSLVSEIRRLSSLYKKHHELFRSPERFRRLEQLKDDVARGVLTDDLRRP